RVRASGSMSGVLPFGGSTTSDVCLHGRRARSPQCPGGPVPTRASCATNSTLSFSSCLAKVLSLWASSCSVQYRFSPRLTARFMGVPMQSSLVHVPCKSGSPHGVFGGAQLLTAVEGFGAVVGAAFGACPKPSAVVTVSAARDRRNGCFIFISLLIYFF